MVWEFIIHVITPHTLVESGLSLDNLDMINLYRCSPTTRPHYFSVNSAVISLNPVNSQKLAPSVSPLPLYRFSLQVIDSTQMTGVFSGGCVYEWSQEVSDYGLVDLGTNGSITLLADYYNLKSEFAQTPMPSGDGDYKATGSASNCPGNSSDFTGWAVLPAIPSAAQGYINNGAGQALGYNGPSNQGLGPDVPSPTTFPSVGQLELTGVRLPGFLRGQILLPGLLVQVVLLVGVQVRRQRVMPICCWLRRGVWLVVQC
jgi:hypothetical protein